MSTKISENDMDLQKSFVKCVSQKVDANQPEHLKKYFTGRCKDGYFYRSFNSKDFKVVLAVSKSNPINCVKIGLLRIDPNDRNLRLDLSDDDVSRVKEVFPNAHLAPWEDTTYLLLLTIQDTVIEEKNGPLIDYLVSELCKAIGVMMQHSNPLTA